MNKLTVAKGIAGLALLYAGNFCYHKNKADNFEQRWTVEKETLSFYVEKLERQELAFAVDFSKCFKEHEPGYMYFFKLPKIKNKGLKITGNDGSIICTLPNYGYLNLLRDFTTSTQSKIAYLFGEMQDHRRKAIKIL